MEITIARITIDEAPVLAELALKTFYDTFTGTCTEEDMDGFLKEYFTVEQVIKELENPNDYYYFAKVNNVPVGYVRLQEDYSSLPLMQQWKALELKRLYVLQEYHGKGVAQALMDFALDFATEKSYQVIWLGVWEFNFRAQKFYSKNGFVNSGHSHPFPIGNTPQTDLWFWKFFN